MATVATSQEIKAADPLATCNIPEFIEDLRDAANGRIVSYKRGKLLGKGGFAKVFAGSIAGRTQYAIKIVAKASLLKVRAQQKLQTEIKIHRDLRHAHVVKFNQFFDDVNFYYIIMELCDYNSMSELLKRRKKLTEAETRYYLIQIVESLQYLHTNLVIHRDLKLGNLFIDASMRIKVGDFGLATRLTHADERRKTVCGTPNYIAPEILEGKTGHSFEVDVWSTGVILYTLLVGKPPFESKDVKSTYKRILSNSYTFPDQTVAPDAQDLIRQMLQARPEARPQLRHIAQHPFFTSPHAYTPTSLPESALHEAPFSLELSDLTQSTEHPLYGGKACSSVGAGGAGCAGGAGAGVGDENDPAAINRLAEKRGLSKGPSSSVSVSSATTLQGAHSLPSRASSATTVGGVGVGCVGGVGGIGSSLRPSARPSHGAAVLERARRNPYSSTPTAAAGTVGTVSAVGSVGSTHPHTSTRPPQPSQFGIYADPPAPALGSLSARSAFSGSTGAGMGAGTSAGANTGGQMGQVGQGQGPGHSFMTRVQTGMQQVRLGQGNQGGGGMEVEEVGQYAQMQGQGLQGQGVQGQVPTASAEAWGWEQTQAAFSPHYVAGQAQMEMGMGPQAHNLGMGMGQMGMAQQAQEQPQQGQQEGQMEVAAESEPMYITTPPDVRSSRETKPPGTLEALHGMLDSSFSVVFEGVQGQGGVRVGGSGGVQDVQSTGGCGDGGMSMGALMGAVGAGMPAQAQGVQGQAASQGEVSAAKVWVVRYVDYTSKYGLGFLFNTGSAGVYFNDSTKIVLSADGTVFQYTERRRRDNSLEHSSQKHLITSYPPELQKKVTLLKHFRNYLVDQQKNTTGGGTEEASAGMRFGLGAVEDEMVLETGVMEEEEMPFLKKWVRTKHAILFRISNRTVQVVFYDRSEVLLSSEARAITYVSKQGGRSQHSLDEVLSRGRVDIAKRLKYTKEIMYRLIHSQIKMHQ
ncbi:hypothetical protein B484DRAFT_52587 [Ochromonadaceae sp. CCMP2298]|nr:hypothetical protein B484DRAFT_52587 [Ochromonadaceae sp. CCMP2298]